MSLEAIFLRLTYLLQQVETASIWGFDLAVERPFRFAIGALHLD